MARSINQCGRRATLADWPISADPRLTDSPIKNETRAAWMKTKTMTLKGLLVVLALSASACGLIPEKVSRNDPRLIPMFDAMARVDRRAFGFTPIAADAAIRLEWGPRNGYDAMLHIDSKTSRTVAFRRTRSGYEWIGEQEIFEGPQKFDTPDGELNESILLNYERVPISGYPVNTLVVSYTGENSELLSRELSLQMVRPILERWGY